MGLLFPVIQRGYLKERLNLVATYDTDYGLELATNGQNCKSSWNVDQVEDLLSKIYGHDRIRRIQAAKARMNYLNANPTVDKRHMTYGELPLELFETALKTLARMTNSESNGSFVDLGSGVGRLTIAAAMMAPRGVWQESVGIEIVSELHTAAIDAQYRLERLGVADEDVLPIRFALGDAFNPEGSPLATATAVYAYSTTWEADQDLVMGALSDSLARWLQPRTVVAVTDRKLREPFVLVDTIVGVNPEKGGPEATSTIRFYRLENK